MLLSNNSYDNHGIHDNTVLPNITILKISFQSWHFDIMINDNIVILPNSTANVLCRIYSNGHSLPASTKVFL